MWLSLRTNILENMFLYFLTSKEERKLTFTIQEIKETFKTRYNWNWDNDLELALTLLITERVSRGQPGLLRLSHTDEYVWQFGFESNGIVMFSTFFTAHEIQEDYEMMRDAQFNCDFEQIYKDAKQAYELITKESFEAALHREEEENQKRFQNDAISGDEEIPF